MGGRIKHAAPPPYDPTAESPGTTQGFAVWSTFHNAGDIPEHGNALRFFSPDPQQALRFAEDEVRRIRARGSRPFDHVNVCVDRLSGYRRTGLFYFRWYATILDTYASESDVIWDDETP